MPAPVYTDTTAYGTDASNAGFSTVPEFGTTSGRAKRGFNWLNFILDHLVTRVFGIAQGGTGATTAAGARAALNVPTTNDLDALARRNSLALPRAVADIDTATPHSLGMYYNDGASRPVIRVDATDFGVMLQSDINSAVSGKRDQNNGDFGAVGLRSTGVYNTGISSGRQVAVQSDGAIGTFSSSRRYKQDFEPANLDADALGAFKMFWFRYRAAVRSLGDDAEQELFGMAEDADKLGLTWLVVYDGQGRPDAINERRLLAAAFWLAQHADQRAAALENRIAKLEAAMKL